MRFHKRINSNLHVFGDHQEDGSWRISVVDGIQRPIASPKLRNEAIKAALGDQSALRKALWDALPAKVQEELRRGSGK